MRLLNTMMVALAAGALAGCGSQKPAAGPVPATPAPAPTGEAAQTTEATQVAAGKVIFQRACIACHGSNGRGSDPEAPDFTSAEWQARHTDSDLLNVIANGHGHMPPFKDKLSEQERREVLAYVRTFPPK